MVSISETSARLNTCLLVKGSQPIGQTRVDDNGLGVTRGEAGVSEGKPKWKWGKRECKSLGGISRATAGKS